MTNTPSLPWGEAMDALVAAPDSHRLLFENDRVRVLEVIIAPGVREPEHTHRWPSVMITDRAARIRYYSRDAKPFESPSGASAPPVPRTVWLAPEGPHSVENLDDHEYHAFRVELLDPSSVGGGSQARS